MIIDKLTLHNFGVYRGRHTIELAPIDRSKPIILFGGMNGGGKTTFLDALLLVLYGKFARCSNRGSLSYEDFLRRSINRNVRAKDGAAIELEFRHRRSNKEESIRIIRTWRATGKGLREIVSVYRDDRLDAESTSRWYEFVEELIPSRIANLFFFDGEKIEDLATAEQATSMIKTGVQALLGLDLIETLEQDLKVVERRRKAKLGTTEDQERLHKLKSELKALAVQRDRVCQLRGSYRVKLDNLDRNLRKLAKSYIEHGGDLYDRREEMISGRDRIGDELIFIQNQLREMAAGDAPLVLVVDLLNDAYNQCQNDKEWSISSHELELLERRDLALLNHLADSNSDTSTIKLAQSFLSADRQIRGKALNNEPVVDIEPDSFGLLLSGKLEDTRLAIIALLRQAESLKDDLATLDRRIESIPDPEGLEGISKSMSESQRAQVILEHKLREFEESHDQINLEIERKTSEIDRLLEANVRHQFASEASKRVISQATATRSLLSEYKLRMSTHHIHRLQQLILESYLVLMRKKSLVDSVKIDPRTFEPTLYSANGDSVPLDRLSAGERQLLAVAILWGLSKASGRTLPTVIDTPLGRLDGVHRENLVASYFPAASHQVILLSTDKEIDETHYATLKRSLGREYSIQYDDTIHASEVVDGYFWRGAA